MNTLQMVPAVAPIKSVIPPVWRHAFGVSLSRTQFVFFGRPPDTDKNSILWRGGRDENQSIASRQQTGGIGHFVTSTAGYLYWRGRFPPPTPPSATQGQDL